MLMESPVPILHQRKRNKNRLIDDLIFLISLVFNLARHEGLTLRLETYPMSRALDMLVSDDFVSKSIRLFFILSLSLLIRSM